MAHESSSTITARAITSARLRHHVRFAGDADAEEVVLLVHGNITSGRCWEPVMRALAKDEPRRLLVAPDLRGYGASETAPVDATRGLRDFSDDLLELLEALGLSARRLHLVGWSLGGNVAMRLLIERPPLWRSVTLIAPGSPFGFGGTRGAEGQPCHEDFAGSGAGVTNRAFVESLRRGDRADPSPRAPRGAVRGLLFARSFRPSEALEDALVDAMLETALGEDNYPGELVASANWPGFAPGARGVNNAMSAKYLDQTGIVEIDPKPPILWVHGLEDVIVSDRSLAEPGGQGARGILAGWPGADVYPPQPMVTQLRGVLRRYAAAGGELREEGWASCGHSPQLERPEEFLELLRELWASAR